MKIHNTLPALERCLKRWKERPTLQDFAENYFVPVGAFVPDLFDTAEEFHSVVEDLNWEHYRRDTLALDPAAEEARLRRHLSAVEDLLGLRLEGEVVLFGAFACMDGYARFDRGSHRVYLGVDESHGRGAYMDILMAHELTHVARESRPEVWTGFGLDPKMTHDEFTELQPVVEHLMGEGFSCVVSELLVPESSGEPWHYAYQTEDSLALALEHGPKIDRRVHAELRDPDGDYGRLYSIRPSYSHYVWAWQWVKRLLRDQAGGDPRKLLSRCSKDFIEDALSFQLKELMGDKA